MLPVVSRNLFAETRVMVSAQETGKVSPLLFGQMLERCEHKPEIKGENGAEMLMDGTGQLRRDARALLEAMQIPVVRFPGGSIVDSPDPLRWTQFIGAIEPAGTRQKNQSLGYDEFLSMATGFKWKTIIAVNFMAIVTAPRDDASLRKAILDSCGVIAYLTARPGAKLPDGMPDWGAIRAANGHPEPWPVDYLQIGNEWIVFVNALAGKKDADSKADVEWIGRCIRETSAMLRTLCPGVPVIGDGVLWPGPAYERGAAAIEQVYSDSKVRSAIDLMTVHVYRPWNFAGVKKNGQPADISTLEPREIWQAMQSVPQINEQGQSVLMGTPGSMPGFALARKYDLPLAVTEWNWNGFGSNHNLTGSFFAKGLAVGGFLHAFIREGKIKLACQSMLAGDKWRIEAIHFPEGKSPYMHPTAQVVGFYQQHHGDRVLATDLQGAPIVEQPLRMGEIEPAQRFSLLDAVATRDDRNIYVHLINRSFDEAIPVVVEGCKGLKLGGTTVLHRLSGSLENNPEPDTPGKDRIRFSRETAKTQDGKWQGKIPARTITILVFPVAE